MNIPRHKEGKIRKNPKNKENRTTHKKLELLYLRLVRASLKALTIENARRPSVPFFALRLGGS